MSRTQYETIYQAAARSGFPVAHIIDYLHKKKMLCKYEGGEQLYSITQMNWLMRQAIKETNYKDFTNDKKAQIIEMFFTDKDNTLTNIVKVTGEKYHRVYKTIDRHMKDLAESKNSQPRDVFITLNSSINTNARK